MTYDHIVITVGTLATVAAAWLAYLAIRESKAAAKENADLIRSDRIATLRLDCLLKMSAIVQRGPYTGNPYVEMRPLLHATWGMPLALAGQYLDDADEDAVAAWREVEEAARPECIPGTNLADTKTYKRLMQEAIDNEIERAL